MHGGAWDDRKGRPYAINRCGPDTPGGVSLQNSLLASSRQQEHGGATTCRLRRCPTSVRKSALGAFSDSFSPRGEALSRIHPGTYCQKICRLAPKASPSRETPQGGFSCPFRAIHLQLSWPRLFGTEAMTDVGVCRALPGGTPGTAFPTAGPNKKPPRFRGGF